MRPTRSLALLTLLPLLAQAADVTGTWTATFDTAVGKQEYTYELKAEGTQLTGRAKSANGDVAIESGTIAGDKISFVEKLSFQGNQLTITYNGTMIGANEIQFKREIAGFGVEELVAKRAN